MVRRQAIEQFQSWASLFMVFLLLAPVHTAHSSSSEEQQSTQSIGFIRERATGCFPVSKELSPSENQKRAAMIAIRNLVYRHYGAAVDSKEDSEDFFMTEDIVKTQMRGRIFNVKTRYSKWDEAEVAQKGEICARVTASVLNAKGKRFNQKPGKKISLIGSACSRPGEDSDANLKEKALRNSLEGEGVFVEVSERTNNFHLEKRDLSLYEISTPNVMETQMSWKFGLRCAEIKAIAKVGVSRFDLTNPDHSQNILEGMIEEEQERSAKARRDLAKSKDYDIFSQGLDDF